MLEHLIYVNTWFPKYEVDLAEQTHYAVFNQMGSQCTSSIHEVKQEKLQAPKPAEQKPAAPTTTAAAADDDDIDLFGSDDEEQSEETKKRLMEYATKKSKKEQIIAKSTIVLDIKPWDDETDLNEMEKCVRSVQTDGLLWDNVSKFVPVAFGVKKLQIGCVVEDDKVGTDFLEEKICEFEDYVQSVDVFSFSKI